MNWHFSALASGVLMWLVNSENQSGRAARKKLAKQILAYLHRRPHAEDYVDGIVQWWLLEQRVHEAVEEVQRTLDWLIAQEKVTAIRQADGRIRFRLRR